MRALRLGAGALILSLIVSASPPAANATSPAKKRAKDPVQQAQATATASLRALAKRTRKTLKKDRKAASGTFKRVAKALKTGKNIETLLSGKMTQKDGTRRAAFDPGLLLTPEFLTVLRETDTRVQLAQAFFDDFTEIRGAHREVDGVPADAGRSGWGSGYDSSRELVEDDLDFFADLLEGFWNDQTIQTLDGPDEELVASAVEFFSVPDIATDADTPFLAPFPTFRASNSEGYVHLEFWAGAPAGGGPSPSVGLLIQELGTTNTIPGSTPTSTGVADMFASTAEGLIPGATYSCFLNLDDGQRQWCVSAGAFQVPIVTVIAPPPDDDPPAPTEAFASIRGQTDERYNHEFNDIDVQMTPAGPFNARFEAQGNECAGETSIRIEFYKDGELMTRPPRAGESGVFVRIEGQILTNTLLDEGKELLFFDLAVELDVIEI